MPRSGPKERGRHPVCAWLDIGGVEEAGLASVLVTAVIPLTVPALPIPVVPEMGFAAMGPFVPEGQSVWSALDCAAIGTIRSCSGRSGLATASEEIEEPQRSQPGIPAIFTPICIALYLVVAAEQKSLLVACRFVAAGPFIHGIARRCRRWLGIDPNPPKPVDMLRASAEPDRRRGARNPRAQPGRPSARGRTRMPA